MAKRGGGGGGGAQKGAQRERSNVLVTWPGTQTSATNSTTRVHAAMLPVLPCICRYISEDYGGIALHPVDLLDAATGGARVGNCYCHLCCYCPARPTKPLLLAAACMA